MGVLFDIFSIPICSFPFPKLVVILYRTHQKQFSISFFPLYISFMRNRIWKITCASYCTEAVGQGHENIFFKHPHRENIKLLKRVNKECCTGLRICFFFKLRCIDVGNRRTFITYHLKEDS